MSVLAATRSRLLLAVSVWTVLGTTFAAEPVRPVQVWTVDFDDPQELARWKDYSGHAAFDLELAPRRADDPDGGRVLQLSASSGLDAFSTAGVYREFPPGFPSDLANPLVVEWEWQIADTEISDHVMLGVLSSPIIDGTYDFARYGQVFSHTLSTVGWAVLFDPPNRWVSHRVNLGAWRKEIPFPVDHEGPLGIALTCLNPVRQVVQLSRLRVEEWPAGALEEDPLFRPHRLPPPHEPFAATPLTALRSATAGALEDLDGDGLPELLVLQWRGWAHLYRNEGGRFDRDLAADSDLRVFTLGTGALFVDLDGDRDRDLAVTSEFDAPHLFEQRAGLRFVERGALDGHYSYWYGVAADDPDGDGDPDLLFVSPWEERYLYLANRGRWRFEPADVFDEVPPASPLCASFSAAFADVDLDGSADLVLGHQHFFRNRGGRLRLDDRWWRVPFEGKTEGTVFADFTGDGVLDLLLLRDATESDEGARSRMLVGDGRAGLVDHTVASRIPRFDSAEVALAEDFDNDGTIDLYVCQRNRSNYLLLNDGSGTFHGATERSGFVDLGGCESAISGDVDGDGGMDIVILSHEARPRVLRNRLDRGSWLGLLVEGRAPATDGIGTRVRAIDAETGEPIVTRWVRAGRGFGSTGPHELRLGLGRRDRVDVEVTFPGGVTRRLPGIGVDRTILLREPGGGIVASARRVLAEFRHPFVVRWRRLLHAPVPPLLVLSLAALTAGLFVAASSGLRWIGFAALLVGLVATLLLGPLPGAGVGRKPAELWLLGGVIGAGMPLMLRAGRRLARRARAAREAVSAEDLVRFTHDFRHAGMETEALLSIEGRVQNLLFQGRLYRPFLLELRERVKRFRTAGVMRLRELLDRADTVFPGLAPSRDLRRCVERLVAELEGLHDLGEDQPTLARWRERALPALRDTRRLLAELLARIDRLCSCDAARVLREVTAHQADAMREAGLRLEMRHVTEPAPALITRGELTTILENLFRNAITAMRGRPERSIVVELRREARRTMIEFQDSGPGIAAEDSERVFEYGFTTRSEGEGYGLARSREILGHFGGSIVLVPGTEGGATFLVTLRAAPREGRNGG